MLTFVISPHMMRIQPCCCFVVSCSAATAAAVAAVDTSPTHQHNEQQENTAVTRILFIIAIVLLLRMGRIDQRQAHHPLQISATITIDAELQVRHQKRWPQNESTTATADVAKANATSMARRNDLQASTAIVDAVVTRSASRCNCILLH